MREHTPLPWANVGGVLMHSGKPIADLRVYGVKANAEFIVKAVNERADLLKAVRSLVNEIEDMDANKTASAVNEKEMKQQYWFGDFSEWEELHSAEGMCGVIIEWPNLAILCKQVRKLLPEKE